MPLLENKKRRLDLLLAGKVSESGLVKEYLESIAFYSLLTVIFLAAIPYGTVETWTRSFFVLIICLIATIRVAAIFLNGSPLFGNGSLIFPIAGLLGLAIIQIIPWSIGTSGETISLDTDATKNFILIFSGLIIASEILLALTNSQKRLKSLIIFVIFVGLSSALFGIIRVYFFNNSKTGLSSYFSVGEGFAQFINRNHFVYLTEMTIGLLLGLLIKGNLKEKQKFLIWVSTGFLILITIFANSRGGIISLTSIFIIAAIIHFLTHGKKKLFWRYKKLQSGILPKILISTALACAVFLIAVVTVAFVGGDMVTTRIESIQSEMGDNPEKRVNRLAIWKPTIELIKERPLLGAGFGGYSAAITKYDKSNGNFSIQQAHNDYLEILANGGIIACIFVLIFGYLFITKAIKQFRSRSNLRRASCFGAILGISGVLIHNFVDFGLHPLINAMIFIVLVVIATAKVPSSEKSLRFAS